MNYEGEITLSSENNQTSIGHDDTGVGSLLKASRLRVDEDLTDVAAALRIRYPYLEAIEENRFRDLPGQTYAIGFVRAYAEHLGLDSNEVVRRYKAESSGIRVKSNLDFPEPVSETGIPGGAVAFVGILLAVLVYGGWYVSTSDKNVYDTLVSPLPDRLVELLPGNPNNTETLGAGDAETSGPVPELTVDTEQTPQPDPETLPEPAQESALTETISEAAIPVTPEATPEETPEVTTPAPAEEAVEVATDPMSSDVNVATDTQEVAEIVTAPVSPPEPVIEEVIEETVLSAEPEKTPAPEPVTETVQPVVEASVVETPVIEAPNIETSVEPTAEPIVAEPVVTEPVVTEPVVTEPVIAEPEPVVPIVEAPPSPPAAPDTSVVTDDNAGRIMIRAKANSWIQIINTTTNEMMMTRLLRAGDEYLVPNQNGLKLLTGNAGALEVQVDGQAVPPIGEDGDVRRGIALDAGRLKAGIAVLE